MKKVNMFRRVIACLLVLVMSLSLTACTTTAGKNSKSYFTYTSDVLMAMFASKDTSKSKKTTNKATAKLEQLATPADFSVDKDGNYKFKGVDKAEYYLIYLCAPDAVKDDDSYLYCSQPIKKNSSNEYSGKISDTVQYAFGKYLVKAYAFPDLTDTKLSMSKAISADYSYSGNLSDPKLAYYWNTFDNTMGVQVSNLNEYLFEAYPDKVEVTFTNVKNSSDTLTLSIDGVSPDNNALVTDKLTRGETYSITAVAESNSEFVLNKKTNVVESAKAVKVGEISVFEGNYNYSDGFANGAFSYPRVCKDFKLSGGVAGTVPAKFGGNAEFICTPATAANGAKYSYTAECKSMFTVTGVMNMFADGTFKMEMTGSGPVEASEIAGQWKDNGDGTVTLSYNPKTVKSKK